MKAILRTLARGACLAAILAGVVGIENVWAKDTGLLTRQNYDFLMRWVNFLILAVVVVKFGRKPILQFLDKKRISVTRSIEDLEEQKRLAEAQVAHVRKQLADHQDKLLSLKERIKAEGQNRKEALIAEAQEEARIMMATAKGKIEGQMQTAVAGLRIELIDMAAELALSKLPAIISAEDQNQWILRWLDSSEKAPPAVK